MTYRVILRWACSTFCKTSSGIVIIDPVEKAPGKNGYEEQDSYATTIYKLMGVGQFLRNLSDNESAKAETQKRIDMSDRTRKPTDGRQPVYISGTAKASPREERKIHHSSWKVLALRLTGGTIGAL